MAIPRETIGRILAQGVRAPSGENCQPWRFVAQGDAVSIYNVPECDTSLYNFNQLGSMVAHGALIENMAIAASSLGYAARVELFPPVSGENCVARVEFTKDGAIAPDPLSEFIEKRCANRTRYASVPFPPEDRAVLEDMASYFDHGAKVLFVDDKKKKHDVAEALSYADQLLFENNALHDFLFQHISWTLKEAAEKRSGFYVKELGLKGPQEAVFKLLRKKSWLKFFRKIGFPKMAAKGNVSLYADVTALGMVVAASNRPTDFVEGGRVMERLWLEATRLGYAIQPLTAIIFFIQRIAVGEARDFSRRQVEGIKSAYAVIAENFGLNNGTAIMLFRIGKGKPIAQQSFRREPEVSYR